MTVTLEKTMVATAKNPVLVALKLLVDVAVFRLKRLEMANLFAALSIMAALSLPASDVMFRLCFAVLLNLLVYLNNDYCDVVQDLKSDKKDRAKTAMLHQYKAVALYTQVALVAVLAAAGAAYSRGLAVTLVVAGGICWLYSSRLKRVAYLDVVAMLLAGVSMPLVGFPLDRILGWALVLQLGLYSACFESIQIIRDHDEDLRSGIRTTAVRLGTGKTAFLLRLFIIVAAAYGALVLHFLLGLIPLAALLVPLDTKRARSYWNRIRLITGICWLAMIAWLFWHESSAGLVWSIGADETINLFRWIR